MSTTQVTKILKAAKISMNGVEVKRGEISVEIANEEGMIDGRKSGRIGTRIFNVLRKAGLEVSSHSGGYGVYISFGGAARVAAAGHASRMMDQMGAAY